MKTAFFHDTTFIKDDDKYYTCGAMNQQKFSKYEKNFGSITAVVKVVKLNKENENHIKEEKLINNIKVAEINRNYSNAKEIVKQQIKENDYAIIRMPSIIGMIACKEARKQNVPYLIEMVGCPMNTLWYHGGLKYKLAMPFITLINKKEIRNSKNTLYVTKDFLQNRYPTKGNNIGCSDVNIEDNSEEIIKNRIKKIENKKDEDIWKIGLIGSLDVEYKGHRTAIKALKLLKKQKIELHFLGIGNKEKWLNLINKYEIREKVFFDGVLPAGEPVYKWMDELDIFLIPSLSEGLPRALIEAMSRGCPCIGTRVGGIPELVEKEYIINKKDYKKLANKLLELMKDENKMKDAAERNFKESKNYQEELLEKRREKFYKKILNRS